MVDGGRLGLLGIGVMLDGHAHRKRRRGVEEALPSTDASADLLLQVNRKDEFVRTRDEYLFG